MRLPSRSTPSTFLPNALESGGGNVRRRNGLLSRTRAKLLAHRPAREVLDVDRDVGELGHGGFRAYDESRRPGEWAKPIASRGGVALWHDARPMYQDLVVLLPGFLGFGHFGGFYYFADRVASSLRGALELQSGRSIPVIPLSTLPTSPLAATARLLAGALTQLDAALGGVERLHLVGHSTGGVDAFLLTQDRPFGGPADPRGPRKKIRSVVTIASPHYGTGLASTDLAEFLGNPLAHIAGLPAIGKTVVDVLRSAPSEPNLPRRSPALSRDWRQSFAFLGQVLSAP